MLAIPSSPHELGHRKRSADYFSCSPATHSHTKRQKTDNIIQRFSKAERTILRGAAGILGTTVPQLLTVAAGLVSTTRTEDETPSDVAEEESRTFNLSLPSSRAHRNQHQAKDQNHHCKEAAAPTATCPKSQDDVLQTTAPLESSANIAHNAFDNYTYAPSTNPVTENPLFADNDFENWLRSYTETLHGADQWDIPHFPSLKTANNIQETLPHTDQSKPRGQLAHVSPAVLEPEPQQPDPTASTPSKQLSPEGVNTPSSQATTQTVSTKGKRRGPFQDPEQRRETSLTRRHGACIRCSMQRIRCVPDPLNLNGCCKTCIQAARTSVHWLPCLRYRLSDAELLDHGTCPRPSWTLRWKKMDPVDIPTRDWTSTHTKAIKVTQDVGGTYYYVHMRAFKPTSGDSMARKWKVDGEERIFECTPYAIANMKETGKTLAAFADQTIGTALCHYTDETDPLLRDTYKMAYHYSRFAERQQERALLRAVLRLWNASRMESRSDRICGTETLSMQPQDYGPRDPNTGLILTSPMFSAQMEVIMTATVLLPAKKEVLKRLKDLVLDGQRRSWFTIYLTMFILLHSCALLTASDMKKARKQGFQVPYFRSAIVESLHNGAKILLAYFHYCCRGSHPFTMDWTSPDQIARAELDAEQVDFMRQTTREVGNKAALFRTIREQGQFDHDYYFISQLYDLDWKPRPTI